MRPAGRARQRLPLPGGAVFAAPPRRVRGRRRRGAISGVGGLAVVPGAILFFALYVLVNQTGSAPPTHKTLVMASLPYWNIGPGTDAVLANRNDLNEVSPWMYGLSGNGQVVLDTGINKSAFQADLSRLRAEGLPIVPTLANVDAQGNWTYAALPGVLRNPARAAQQVAGIVALVDANHYAGIDLDYENLNAGDRQAFTAFVTGLAGAVHAQAKVLAGPLFAKATVPGYATLNVAQDYAAI